MNKAGEYLPFPLRLQPVPGPYWCELSVPGALAVLCPSWTTLRLHSDAASSTGKRPCPPHPVTPIRTNSTAWVCWSVSSDTECSLPGGPVSCATELPFNPHGPGPASAQARSSGCPLHTLGLLTWAGRALGCRPPAAPGEAAPGTGCPAGSPRPCPPRGPGHSTGSSARLLPHRSRCRPPAGTATWGKPESGGPRGVGGFPSPPQTGKGPKRFSLRGSLLRLH